MITGEVRGVIDVFPALSRIVIDKADPERGLQFIVRSNFGSPISSIDSKTEKGVYAVNTESVDGKEARMTLKLRNVNTVNQVSSGWDAISLTVNFADATPSEKMTVHSFFVVEDAIVPTPTIVTPKQLADGISVTLLNKQGGIPDLEHFRLSARLNENDLLLVRNVRKLSDYMVRFDIKVSPETEIPVGSDRLDLELKMGDDSFQTAIKIVGL